MPPTSSNPVADNQAAAAKLGISLPGVGSGTGTADVAGNQAAAAKLGISLPGVNGAAPPPPVSQTQNASSMNSQLSGTTSGTIFPTPPPPPTNGTSANTSVANPIATPQDIIDQGNAQTPGEQTNQSLLQKVAALIGQKQSQTGLTNTAETNAGVPALTKTVSDLNTQLEGLNNQATDLKNQASPGGAIQNQEQQNVLGRGVTAAGLAPQTAGDLRKNQIQQSAIASQALTLKSAIYGAQGQLTLAKDAADKAAQAQYEDQQNQIDYQNALIQANLPQMNKEEKNQALLVQTQLADRQQQIQNAQDDKKTIIAMATAVMQGHPNDPAAQYAAQQALTESNQQQPDLQKVLGLIGNYSTLDTQLKVAQIADARLNAQKTAQDIANADVSGGAGQQKLFQAGVSTLKSELSNRSGGLGLQDAKVNQAIHLKALLDQYKTTQTVPNTGSAGQALPGTHTQTVYNIPASQYTELAMGLASLISPSNTVAEGTINNITQATAIGDLNKAITYATGSPQSGSSNAIFQNIADSVDRQGSTAEGLRQTYVNDLIGRLPPGLSTDNQNSLIKASGLNSYTNPQQNYQTGEPTDHSVGATWTRPDGTYVSDGTQWVKK